MIFRDCMAHTQWGIECHPFKRGEQRPIGMIQGVTRKRQERIARPVFNKEMYINTLYLC
jgi:hypothetical protein